ncbi:MAG: acetyl-CoA carboxylase biotin carboxyl carrier protein [Rhodobacter sp.]|nr:acetyl-CoA carboxylase biotin carboxyl carrier protein [Rhodobacter sp.]
MPMKPADIEALVDLFGKSGWDELHIEIDGEELFLSRDSRARGAGAGAVPGTAAPMAAAPAAAAVAVAPSAAPPAAAAAAPAARPAHWVAIKAANLGTYYRAASPEAPPYVTLGARVSAESEVCMIEVMKLFTTIRAGIAGTVREICVSDGQMVEFGQDLIWIEPA